MDKAGDTEMTHSFQYSIFMRCDQFLFDIIHFEAVLNYRNVLYSFDLLMWIIAIKTWKQAYCSLILRLTLKYHLKYGNYYLKTPFVYSLWLHTILDLQYIYLYFLFFFTSVVSGVECIRFIWYNWLFFLNRKFEDALCFWLTDVLHCSIAVLCPETHFFLSLHILSMVAGVNRSIFFSFPEMWSRTNLVNPRYRTWNDALCCLSDRVNPRSPFPGRDGCGRGVPWRTAGMLERFGVKQLDPRSRRLGCQDQWFSEWAARMRCVFTQLDCAARFVRVVFEPVITEKRFIILMLLCMT